MDKIREEFEAWHIEQCKADGMDLRDLSSELDRDGDGYVYTGAQYAWRGWKASRAEMCVDMPEEEARGRFCDSYESGYVNGYNSALLDVRKRLDKNGVSYK